MDTMTAADAIFSATSPAAAQYDNLAGIALGRGIDAFSLGNYDTAIREFKRTLSLSPYSDNALSAFEYMANAYEKSGRTEEALKTLQQAVTVFPSADGLHLNLGNLLFAQDKYTEALDQYLLAVKKNGTVSQNNYSAGQAYLALGQYNEAEGQFKRVIALSPREASGYYALGQTYRKAGRYDEAETMLNRALAIDHGLVDAQYELGLLYTQSGQTEAAQAQLEILADLDEGLYTELENDMFENAKPKFLMAYITNLNLAAGPGTEVATLDASLQGPGSLKTYTLNFIFDKPMDPASVQSSLNWSISRSADVSKGGYYNWGMEIPATEVSVSPMPLYVVYDQEKLLAQVTFAITQNAAGNGTIDLSHLKFQFLGTDVYGNRMDAAADEYSGVSRIV
jgi:tetratricopeptide (TPR) repeat protein